MIKYNFSFSYKIFQSKRKGGVCMERKQLLKKLAASIVAFSVVSVIGTSMMTIAEAAPPHQGPGSPRWEENRDKRRPAPPPVRREEIRKEHQHHHNDKYRRTPPPPPPRRPEYHNHHRREEIKTWYDRHGHKHKDRIWWDRYGNRHVERIF